MNGCGVQYKISVDYLSKIESEITGIMCCDQNFTATMMNFFPQKLHLKHNGGENLIRNKSYNNSK